MSGKYKIIANEKLEQDIPVLQEVVGGVWKREDELKNLKSDLAALERKIQLTLEAGAEASSLDYALQGRRRQSQISLTPQKEEQATNEQSDTIRPEPVVGRIKYLGFGGDVAEVMEYDDKEKYLKAIKNELYCNQDGFRAFTISKDPELRKSVDDLYYGEYCAENPNTIEHHIKLVAQETATQTSDTSTKPISTSNGHAHSIEPSATATYVSGESPQTNGRSNSSGESAGQANTHSLKDGRPPMRDNVLIITIHPPKEEQAKPRFRL